MRKRSQRDQATADTNYRSLIVRAATFNEEGRSVEAVISTEQPVDMPDWGRQAMVPEVLVPSGAEFPSNRQVPFLDSHQRRSVKDQLGSAREIKVNGNEIIATLVFRKSKESDDALGGVRDGHITDVSVGYDVLKRQYIEAGAKKTIGNRTYEGPVNVVTKWRLREVSLTPIGADDQAKLRGLDPAKVRFKSSEEQEDFTMNAELRALLLSKGMSADLTDEQAQRWLIDNAAKLSEVKEEKKEERSQSQNSLPSAADLAKLVADATREAISTATATRKAFEVDVRELCELADMPGEVEACRAMEDIAAVRKHIKDVKAKTAEHVPYGASVRHVGSGAERLRSDIGSILAEKAVRSAVNGDEAKLEKHLPAANRSKTAGQLTHATLLDLATEFVRSQGVQVLGLTREQIAICAMFGPKVAGIRNQRDDGAYNTTGSFANLTLDAINKSMMVGYQEVPATWRGPMRQGDSVADFKAINRIRLGGIPNLPVWNTTEEPDRASMKDAKESYAVEARSIGVDFNYKLIVNDDMSALTRIPLALGDSAARTVNAVAWSQITSNPTMGDSVALFSGVSGNRKQSNATTGSVSDYTAAINTMTNLMMVMKGENTPEEAAGPDILALMPTYCVFPAALRGTLLQLIYSQTDPKASVAGIPNINNGLIPVVEPLLDGASTTAFYLFANPSRIDTVEVTFLQGQETPQVRSVMDEHTLAMTYYVLQSVGAKPLNHRGIQRHAGA